MSPTKTFKRLAAEAIDRISGWLPSGYGNGSAHSLKYEILDSPRGPIIVVGSDKQKYVLGNVVDQPYFRKEDFTLGELEVITAASERSNRIWAKDGFRTYTGMPGPDHPAMVMGTMAQNAEAAKVKLRTSGYLLGIPHDDIELLVDRIYRRWKSFAVAAHYELSEKDKLSFTSVRDTLTQMLREARRHYQHEGETEYRNAIPKGLDHESAKNLSTQITRGASNARHITRDANERIYSESMRFQFGRIGPENFVKMQERHGAKFGDRTRNTVDVRPDGIYYSVSEAYKDPMYARLLLERFGPVNSSPKQMVPSVMVKTAFGTFPGAHFFNVTNNRYGPKILATEDDYAIGLNRWTIRSRNVAIGAANSLLDNAIEEFEKRPEIQKKKLAIERELTALVNDPKYMGRLTHSSNSVLLKLMELDVLGTKYMEKYDETEEGMVIMYKAARILRKEFENFMLFREIGQLRPGKRPVYLADQTEFDANKHKWFTMPGFDDGVRRLPSMESILGQEMYAESRASAVRLLDEKDEIISQALFDLQRKGKLITTS